MPHPPEMPVDQALPARGLSIRPMTAADIDFADALRSIAGWNQTRQDWQRFLRCEPGGCFVAERDSVPAGTATTTSYGPALGWIGMLLVHPNHRRTGVGSALLQHCVSHLQARGTYCLKLDATPLGKAVYERFGFTAEYPLTRWETPGLDPHPSAPDADLAPLSNQDLPRVAALDARAFGCNRPTLLGAVAQQAAHALVSRIGGEFGFGMLREGSRACYLGPVAAEAPETAMRIVRALLARVPNRAVFWDILDLNAPAVALARKLGFTPQRPLLRMYLGQNPGSGEVTQQFGLVDPAVG